MSWHVSYYPVLNCSSVALIFFDDASRLQEYSYNDVVFCSSLVNTGLSNDLLCCQHHEETMSTVSISLLYEFTNSATDVMFLDISLHLPYVNDCLLFIRATKEMSNLVIKSESMLFNSCGFDSIICVVYDLPLFELIIDFNMSLDVDAIFAAHSQLVSKALGSSWVMLLKQWLSWLKYLCSLNINKCLMLCCQFLFDNGYFLFHVICMTSQKSHVCCFHLQSFNIHGLSH